MAQRERVTIAWAVAGAASGAMMLAAVRPFGELVLWVARALGAI